MSGSVALSFDPADARLRGRGIAEAQACDGGGFAISYAVQLAASPERVFAALTEEVGRWWPHTVSDTPHAVELEPRIGGRFYELFDAEGRGALYGHVELYDPPRRLRVRGSIAMALAVQVVYTVTLEELAGGTLLREDSAVVGQTSERLMRGMTAGTEEEYGEALRAWLERGEARR